MKKVLLFAGLAAASVSCNSPEPTAVNADTDQTIGYQLYTVREHLTDSASVIGTLKESRAMGYELMESFGYFGGQFFGFSSEDFASEVAQADLQSPSGHYLPMQLADTVVGPIDRTTIPQFLDAAEALGQHWVIIPWMSDAWRNADGYGYLVNYLRELADSANARGLRAAWHNHDFEFAPLYPDSANSPTAYDYLLAELPADLMDFEMDLHWVAFAGENPVQWFNAYPGRFPLWHVKDFAADTTSQVPVGQGVIPWEEIFAARETAGLKYYFLEQDVCSGTAAKECLRQSINWTKEQSFMH